MPFHPVARAVFAAVFCLHGLVGWGTPPAQGEPQTIYNPDPYLRDLDAMKQIIASEWPNLDWAISERGVDLVWRARQTEAWIRTAVSDEQARWELRDFVKALGDGHVSITFPDEMSNFEETGVISVCQALGYTSEPAPEGLPFEEIGATPVETDDSGIFPTYLINLPAGVVGILRLPSFWEFGYFDYCPAAVKAVGLPEDGECDDVCAGAIQKKTAEMMTEAVKRQIEALKAKNVRAILVDITQNGGGTVWLDPVARMLTPIKLMAPSLAFTRTPKWQNELVGQISLVDSDLNRDDLSADDRQLLQQARNSLTKALSEASQSCDRARFWWEEQPACSILADTGFFTTGIMNYAAPGQYAHLAASSVLFYPSAYTYQEGVWQGPLYVLTDEGTVSASELFAAMLKDSGAATLIGEPTLGAGCGWFSGGPQFHTLPGTGASFFMPDCAWRRPDGSNMVAGVEPDILLPWRAGDTAAQKVRRLKPYLEKLGFSGPAAPPAPVAHTP